MRRMIWSTLLLASVITPAATAQRSAHDPRALAMIDRGIARMGGEAALRGVNGIRMEVMTQWQRTTFGDHPYADAPSFERNSDLRDYTTRSWRNTRNFSLLAPGPLSVTVVRDTVASRWTVLPNAAPTVAPLSVAYVDDRRELFAFASERLLLVAKDAGGTKALSDTTINGALHGRFTATVDGYPATYFVRKSDDLPTMVRFTADETNDFGLAPWGMMEVEFWYSGWGKLPPGVLVARQLDVRRVGRPYKRMTVLAAVINPPMHADSFAIADSTVSAFFATQNKPMWDAPLDSAKIVADNFASFPPFSGMLGAVRIGGKWVALETGQAAGAAKLIHDWLDRTTPGTSLAAGVVTATATSNGGVRWFADEKLPFWFAPGGTTMIRTILGPKRATSGTSVTTARWVKVGSDSLWLEPLDLTGLTGALVVYSPTLRWLYSGVQGAPLYQGDFDALIARYRAKGMPVEWTGGGRSIRVAVK